MEDITRRNFLLATSMTLGSSLISLARLQQQPSSLPVRLNSSGITVLMADRSQRSDSLKEFRLGSIKRFWIENWSRPEEYFQWTVESPEAGPYDISLLIAGGPQIEVEIAGPQISSAALLSRHGWDKVNASTALILPKGLSKITARLRRNNEEPLKTLESKRKPNDWFDRRGSGLHLKSLELTPAAAKSNIEKRVKALHSSAEWLAEAKYGLMFQWGDWGYPSHGDRKPWPQMINDFNVDAFAKMVEETGAGYCIWSATWRGSRFPAPIKAIDRIVPGHTTKRDLIGDLIHAFGKRNIKLLLYYHPGHEDKTWWAQNWVSIDRQERFTDNYCSLMNEVGERYGKGLSGWLIDDAMVLNYPAPFERMTKAMKAGYPERIVSYNSWILPRVTEFQDFSFGEGFDAINHWPTDRKGVFIDGPQKGQQAQFMDILDGPDWGIWKPETIIQPPRFTDEQIADLVKNAAVQRKALSFNLLMYEDGSVSPQSLERMRTVRKIIRGK